MMTKRSTVRIDDDLMSELKALAHRENVSLTRILNRVIRRGLTAEGPKKSGRYREKPLAMGEPRVEIDKALTLVADLDDEEIIRKLSLRK